MENTNESSTSHTPSLMNVHEEAPTGTYALLTQHANNNALSADISPGRIASENSNFQQIRIDATDCHDSSAVNSHDPKLKRDLV
jgi:hypothetical protein